MYRNSIMLCMSYEIYQIVDNSNEPFQNCVWVNIILGYVKDRKSIFLVAAIVMRNLKKIRYLYSDQKDELWDCWQTLATRDIFINNIPCVYMCAKYDNEDYNEMSNLGNEYILDKDPQSAIPYRLWESDIVSVCDICFFTDFTSVVCIAHIAIDEGNDAFAKAFLNAK